MSNIRSTEEIMENLMKKKGCYDENAINKHEKEWSSELKPYESRRDALYSIGLKKHCFTEEEVKKYISFEVFKDNFDNYDNFEEFYNKLSERLKEKFLKLSHFYYCWCRDPLIYRFISESFKLIIMTSIIEALMSDYDYKEFKEWLDSDCSNELKNKVINDNKILKLQIGELWNEYKKNYGAAMKVKKFFDKFLSIPCKEELIAGFHNINKITTLKKTAEWLYSMRSEFIHKAKAVPLHERNDVVGCSINNQPSVITIGTDKILSIFERGFIAYFKESYEQ